MRLAVEALLHNVASTSWQQLAAAPWASLPGIEEGDDGEHAAVIIARLWKAKLAEDAVDVFFHGSLRHPQLAGDPGIRAALGHQRENLLFTRREVSERVVDAAGGDKFLDESGIDD